MSTAQWALLNEPCSGDPVHLISMQTAQVRHVLDAHSAPLPAILEIPSKDRWTCPSHACGGISQYYIHFPAHTMPTRTPFWGERRACSVLKTWNRRQPLFKRRWSDLQIEPAIIVAAASWLDLMIVFGVFTEGYSEHPILNTSSLVFVIHEISSHSRGIYINRDCCWSWSYLLQLPLE